MNVSSQLLTLVPPSKARRVRTPEQKAKRRVLFAARTLEQREDDARRKAKQNKALSQEQRVKRTVYHVTYRAAHPDTPKRRAQHAVSGHKYKALHKERARTLRRFRDFGLAPEAFDVLLDIQRGACAICRVPMASPHVDHDHATGRVRGLLCSGCNRGLGGFRDSPKSLVAAADYLSKGTP